MKNKIAKGLLSLFFMSFIIACISKKTEPAAVIDKELIKKEIQAKEDEYAELYNKGEIKYIGYYAEDATTFAQNKKPLVGRDAIVEYLKVDALSASNQISFKTNEVFPSNDGNMVIEIGYYTVIDSTKTAINTGNYMVMFEKRNGKYYSVREMSVSDMPLE